MNKYEKEVQKQLLEDEKKVLEDLEKTYTNALVTIKARIKELKGKNDELTQSQIYQLKFQENLEKQVSAIIELLKHDINSKTNTYLVSVYENSFVGEAYNLSKAYNMETFIGIDQKAVFDSVNKKIDDMTFAERTDINMNDFKKNVKNEISRGFSTGMSYPEMARSISLVAERDMYKAYRIARTEGLRVQSESKLDYGNTLKEKYGADLVKEWDSTLDGVTRPEHQELDGQMKELDEDFECSGGKAQAPGLFGNPAMDCNCRCCVLQIPRWAVGIPLTKLNNANPFKDDNSTNLINGKDYEEYRKNYFKYWQNHDKISKTNKEVKKGVKYIGKIDTNKLGEYKNKVITDDVVLTDERIKHIQQRHPGDFEEYIDYVPDIIYNPDYIVEDKDNEDTVLCLKTIIEKGKKVQVVVKLSTNFEENEKSNSILTFWHLRTRNYKSTIKNNKKIYEKLDKNE